MYLVNIEGVDDVCFETVNYDDAERVVALIVEYGKTKKTAYQRDEYGDIIEDERGYGVKIVTEKHSMAMIQYIEDRGEVAE